MTPRRSRIAAFAVAIAALATAGPAGAATPGHGLGGYVTDADTGLGLGPSTVTWNGATTPAPTATTDPQGRFAFFGLQPGETGSLAVTGPAGYDRVTLPGLTVPADGVGTQNVAVHRDWASSAGGARPGANDESAGCGAAAAVDSDPATAWSVPAGRPAADPATLTVELPRTIDVTQLVLDAGSACGHDAGTALGRYRVDTSPDGTKWATAATGELAAADRGSPKAVAPAANAAGVRFVRLVALAPQDPAATTIDVRELQVVGLGPNVAPTGTVSVDAPRNYINAIVRLHAAFTDPDTTILRYLWDFDGDGTWDQSTVGPTVAHVWAGTGTYHVTVGARDFRGALGTTTLDLRLTDPNQPVEPIIQRKPLITFDPPTGIDLPVRIACSSKCTFTAKMVLTTRTARKLHVRRTVLTFKRKTEGPGLGSWTLQIPQKLIKRLRAAHMAKVNVRLTAGAVDQEGRHSTVHHWATFR